MNVRVFVLKHLSAITILILCIVAVIPYSNIFGNQFVYDDFDFFVHWDGVKSLEHIPSFFQGNLPTFHQHVYRPLRSLVQAVVYSIAGGEPFGFHVFSLGVHIAAVLLVYVLAKRIVPRGAAFITALLFAVLPIHTDSITFMTASFDTLGTVFVIAALYLYSIYRDRGTAWAYSGSIACAVISFFMYEIALVLPLLIMLYDACFKEGKIRKLLRRARYYAPYFIGVVIYVAFRMRIVGHRFGGSLFESDPLGIRILTMLKGFVWYLYIMTVNYPLSISHLIPPARSLAEPAVFGSLIGVLGLLAFGVYCFRREKKLCAFLIFWFFISLAPVSNIIPLAIFVSEHYSYLTTFAWCAAFGFGLHVLYQRSRSQRLKSVVIGLVVVLLIIYGGMTVRRNQDWRDNVSIFSSALAVNSHYAGGYNGLAFYFRLQKDYDRATDYAEKALAENPKYYVSHALLGEIAMEQGKHQQAVAYFDDALALNDSYVSAYLNRGVSYFHLQDFERAEADYLRALEIYPEYLLAHRNLGIVYLFQGKFQEAIPHLERVVAEDDDAEAYYGLGVATINVGNIDRGVELLNRALEVNPAFEAARDALQKIEQ